LKDSRPLSGKDVLNSSHFYWIGDTCFLSHNACTATAIKTLIAQLEPLLHWLEIIEEIQWDKIKIVDLDFDIHQILLTFIDFP
jgi:hypothetical protein